MTTTKTLVAETPEILYSFLQNRLERDYFIYCQFSKERCPHCSIFSSAKGIEFKFEQDDSASVVVISNYCDVF